ncbi:hypothetical protein OSB04_007502 [Centaurea solstitialis]|uniref:Reverse transcriptase domain-containing protein n=1 Tax=Centaurea solstitialis TaxID=347529 RepID=A0AA38WIJ3_9ASTR|nr:hypothetical protein OSB04_007502 [Centaurea solstitialis]
MSKSIDSPKVPGDVSPKISGDKSFQNPDPGNFDTTPPVVETPVPKHSISRTKTPISVHSYIPFPQRLRNQKEEIQFKKFLDIFKQLHINIPLVEAIEKMPNYAKILKDILSKKKKLTEYETLALTKECSALVTNKIPPKLKDPGSFTIPCSIGSKTIGKALCDLGAGFGGRETEKYEKRRENVKNAQSESSSLLAIAKSQIWRHQVRQIRILGFALSTSRRESAVWRTRNGL